MNFEQNLFRISSLILRTPKIIFVALLIFAVTICVLQVNSVLSQQTRSEQVSDCLYKYYKQKQQQALKDNKKMKNLINASTILNVTFGSQCQCQLDASPSDNREIMQVTKTRELLDLIFLNKTLPQQYQKKHNIVYDRLTLPEVAVDKPIITFFYRRDIEVDELAMRQFGDALKSLDEKIFKEKDEQNKNKNGLNKHQEKKQDNRQGNKQDKKQISSSNTTIVQPLQSNQTTQSNQKQPYYSVFSQLYVQFYYIYDNKIDHSHQINLTHLIFMEALSNFFNNSLRVFFLFISIFLLSIALGLMIRLFLVLSVSAFLVVIDRCYKERWWGWVHNHLEIIVNRFGLEGFRLSSLKFLFFYLVSFLGMTLILIVGLYCLLNRMVLPASITMYSLYGHILMKTIFLVELFHLVFIRSRVSLRFFPIMSLITTLTILMISQVRIFFKTQILMNLNLGIQLSLFLVFILIEQTINQQKKNSISCETIPSLQKPRMLFLAGYDVSWQRGLPPLWTYFNKLFDYSYFSDKEKCFIQKDYQLLYGNMMGMNQRQELPEEVEQEQQGMEMRQQASNEVYLMEG